MISTIQLHEEVKDLLDKRRLARGDSYQDVIVNLLNIADKIQRQKQELLIEQCKAMSEDALRITKEWETTDNSLDWEWDDKLAKG